MTRRLLALSTMLTFSAFLVPHASQAAVIFSNLGPNSSYETQFGNTVGEFGGDNLAEANTFTPTMTVTFGQVQIALACNNASCPNPYTVRLTSDNGANAPGTVIESFTGSGLLLGQIGATNPLSVFQSTLLPTLAAGTQYWITVATDLANSITWNANTTGDPSDQAFSSDGGATYDAPSFLSPGAYQVSSLDVVPQPVPEPGTMVLLAVGVALWAGSRVAFRRDVMSGLG